MVKAIRIIVPEAHDGLGGIHRQGDVVSLPDDVTQVFLDRKIAVEASEVDFKQAKALAAKREDDQRAAELHGAAKARMSHYDSLPPDVRQELQETDAPVHEAVVKHLADEPVVDEWDEHELTVEDAEPERPKRGRKKRKADET